MTNDSKHRPTNDSPKNDSEQTENKSGDSPQAEGQDNIGKLVLYWFVIPLVVVLFFAMLT